MLKAADVGDPPQWRTARRVVADRAISIVDPDARHAHKAAHGIAAGSVGTGSVVIMPQLTVDWR